MKKIILIAAIGVAGLTSAKNIDVKEKEKEKEDKKTEQTEKKTSESGDPTGRMQCISVGMYVWCTGEVASDTVCWGSGSGTATYEQAIADSIHNSQLYTEFHCGLGTGSGPGGN